ncbi:hypothetical protein BA059_21430 [Mycolicibacterium sp. (ex Dasyatis americana)]|nr:hypothetical protein BA059_21430 [Mycolicibacterium sp. (ex Dasyatis americana)]
MTSADLDVIVAGAGVSGLVAARRLVSGGLTVAVVEARPQVGGRTMLTEAHGITIDRGGQFFGTGMRHLVALLEELQIGTKPNGSMRNPDDLDVWYRKGERQTYRGELPPLSESGGAALLTAMGQLQAMSDGISLEKPWDSPGAARLDAMTLGAWLDANVTDEEATHVLTALFSLACVAPPAQLSMLFALWFLAGAGGIEGMGADVDLTIVGGAGSVAQRLATDLGDRVRCDWPLRIVDRTDDGVSVTGPGGEVLTARRLIIAMSPADARHIEFGPQLPTARQALQTSWQQHAILKFHVFYDTPFWRAGGLSGAALSDLPGAPIVFDGSPEDDSVGILLGFLAIHSPRLFGGNEPELLDDPERLRDEIVGALTEYFGAAAAEPTTVLIHNWALEPHISGVLGATPPGLLTAFGEALRSPVGPIHWAGTETALRWSGWISGAVEAGERAAREVADALQPAN